MGNNIQLFDFKGSQVRIFVNENGDPEFCAKDICNILGYSNSKDAVIRHCKSTGVVKHDLGVVTGKMADGSPSIQEVEYSFINEGNLYRLILRSEKPEAEPFNDWVTEEILPSIRKHGIYATSETVDKIISDPDFGIKLLTALKEANVAKENAEKEKQLALQELSVKNEQIAIQYKIIDEQRPKVEYHDKVLNSPNLLSINDIAIDLDVSSIKLNQTLRKLNIQYKQGDRWFLYSKYRGQGYTRDKTYVYKNKDGVEMSSISMYWTQEGKLFIYREFIKHIHMLPEKIQKNVNRLLSQ